MSYQRIAAEIHALRQNYRVTHTTNCSVIKLHNFEVPNGWAPSPIVVRLELSNHYPDIPPEISVPADLTYQTVTPKSIKKNPYSDWARYQLPTPWTPEKTLSVLVEELYNDMITPFPATSTKKTTGVDP